MWICYLSHLNQLVIIANCLLLIKICVWSTRNISANGDLNSMKNRLEYGILSNHVYLEYGIMSNHLYLEYGIMSNHLYLEYGILSNHLYLEYGILSNHLLIIILRGVFVLRHVNVRTPLFAGKYTHAWSVYLAWHLYYLQTVYAFRQK